METYRHILLAADFSPHGDCVGERAVDLARQYQSELSVLHVVDNLPIADSVYGPVIPFSEDFTNDLIEAGKKRLAEFADKFSIPTECRWLEIGSPKLEIIRIAEAHNVDLIVVGSHGRHGLQLLLGSTANSILHHAKCDVLAVRLKDD